MDEGCECLGCRIGRVERRLLIDEDYRKKIPQDVLTWLMTDILKEHPFKKEVQ